MPVHKQTHRTIQNHVEHQDATDIQKKLALCFSKLPKNKSVCRHSWPPQIVRILLSCFLHKLVLYHVPTQKPIDATLSPLSILKNSKFKNLKVDISYEKVRNTVFMIQIWMEMSLLQTVVFNWDVAFVKLLTKVQNFLVLWQVNISNNVLIQIVKQEMWNSLCIWYHIKDVQNSMLVKRHKTFLSVWKAIYWSCIFYIKGLGLLTYTISALPILKTIIYKEHKKFTIITKYDLFTVNKLIFTTLNSEALCKMIFIRRFKKTGSIMGTPAAGGRVDVRRSQGFRSISQRVFIRSLSNLVNM